MRYIATGQEVFRIDEFATNVIGIPQLVLMERAALRIAEHVKERFPAGAHVLIVVESGNNGGDGIAAGRILMMEGYDVEIYWVDGLKSASTGFDAQYAIAKKLNMKFVDELVNAGYDVIIDGIFGVGLSRAVMGRQAEVIKALKEARALGDLSENADYDAARNEQAIIEAKIQELEYKLEHAEIIDNKKKNEVSLGSTVTISYDDGEEE